MPPSNGAGDPERLFGVDSRHGVAGVGKRKLVSGHAAVSRTTGRPSSVPIVSRVISPSAAAGGITRIDAGIDRGQAHQALAADRAPASARTSSRCRKRTRRRTARRWRCRASGGCRRGRARRCPLSVTAHAQPHFTYFQLRILPSAIHSTAVLMRFSRVAACWASITHAMYSRRWPGGNPSKVALGLLVLRERGEEIGRRLQGRPRPLAHRRRLHLVVIQLLRDPQDPRQLPVARQVLRSSRSCRTDPRPTSPAPGRCSFIKPAFQNPNATCSLNAAMPQNIPL